MTNSFVHLHFHTSYSLLDGYNPISKAVNRLKELGMKSCAITDHGNLGGIPEWQDTCRDNGIKPILGVESYWTPDISEITKDVKIRKKESIERMMQEGLIQDKDNLKEIDKKGLQAYCTEKGIPYESFPAIAEGDKPSKQLIDAYMCDMHSYHLILLAMNQVGWKNLIKMQSIACTDGLYNGRGHVDNDLLRQYSEGIICQAACISSYFSRMVQKGRQDIAEQQIQEFASIFGNRFYLEIQPLSIQEQWQTNLFYMEMAQKYGIHTVATNDVHWTLKSDYDDHDTLLCIGTNTGKTEEIDKKLYQYQHKNEYNHGMDRYKYRRMRYANEFWIRSGDEMRTAFERQSRDMVSCGCIPTEDQIRYDTYWMMALKETEDVANRITDDIKIGSNKPLFSHIDVPEPLDPAQYLEELSWMGLYEYLKEHPDYDRKVYEHRLRTELDVIIPKGFAPYMLTVREYVRWANEHDCETGPGRGSASGSLCLLCLGITKNVDPIQEHLLFSRFLTKDRKDPPDIDVDFQNVRTILHHLEERYGKDHVAKIGTWGTLGVKSGVKAVAKIYAGYTPSECDAISKAIDEVNVGKAQPSFKDYDKLAEGDDKEKEEYKKFHEIELKYPEFFRLARCFEGSPCSMGVHASGVLVTPCPITDYFPLHKQADGTITTFWTGPQLEHYQGLKYDVLGLNTLQIIHDTLKSINEDLTFQDLYEEVGMKDPSLYEYIRTGETDGIFQLESNLMKGLIKIMEPTSFEDICAINACARPGPLSAGFDKMYGEGKRGHLAQPPIRGCEDILEPTMNVILYQEELMRISKKVSGFDDMQADSITRRVTAKKKRKLFPMMKRCHIFGKKNCEGPEGWENDDHAPWYDPQGKLGKEIPGAIANGYTEKEMLDYFDAIEGFASYSFNASHCACYSYIGILSTWLKKNYPEEFMAAVISNQDKEEKKIYYINVCENNLGIKVVPPDINKSGISFTPDSDHHQILYGIGGIKSVGEKYLSEILAGAPYKSVEDAVARIPRKAFNKRAAENLIKAGAFDFESKNRYILLNRLHKARKDKKEPELDPMDYTPAVCIQMEQEAMGIAITFKPWWDGVKNGGIVREERAEILSVEERKDKKGGLMAFVKLKIRDCEVRGILFASRYAKLVSAFDINRGVHILITGKKDAPRKTGEPANLIINDAKKDFSIREEKTA